MSVVLLYGLQIFVGSGGTVIFASLMCVVTCTHMQSDK